MQLQKRVWFFSFPVSRDRLLSSTLSGQTLLGWWKVSPTAALNLLPSFHLSVFPVEESPPLLRVSMVRLLSPLESRMSSSSKGPTLNHSYKVPSTAEDNWGMSQHLLYLLPVIWAWASLGEYVILLSTIDKYTSNNINNSNNSNNRQYFSRDGHIPGITLRVLNSLI